MAEELQMRIHGDASLPTLVYLPGLHGDWTLAASFRKAVEGKVRFVEFTYPRTTEWTLGDYAEAVERRLLENGITSGWLLAESFSSQVAWELLERSSGAPPEEPKTPRVEVRTQATAEAPLTASLSPQRMRGGGARRAGEGCGGGTAEEEQDAPCVPSGLPSGRRQRFTAEGIILAGGFVKYPRPWRVRCAEQMLSRASDRHVRWFLGVYARYARFRHRHAPETMQGVAEFVARRTEQDRLAMLHRLRLIRENDPGAIASQTTLPVFQLFGLIDPVVPGFATKRWLKKHCPGWRESRVLCPADHNILGTAPKRSAEQVLRWLNGAQEGAR